MPPVWRFSPMPPRKPVASTRSSLSTCGTPALIFAVVGLGDGKFDVYFLTGGLPGAGWDKKGRAKVAAKTEGDKTIVSGKGWTGTIAEGALSGKTEGGDAFTLKRVVRQSPAAGAKPPE